MLLVTRRHSRLEKARLRGLAPPPEVKVYTSAGSRLGNWTKSDGFPPDPLSAAVQALDLAADQLLDMSPPQLEAGGEMTGFLGPVAG